MASIYKEIIIDAKPEHVWDALADFGALHTRLASGFVINTEIEPGGGARLVTFSNGSTARELLVTKDEARRRIVYAVAPNERITQHSASAQVFDDDAKRSRFVWIADLLPNEVGPYVDEQMELGIGFIKQTLERR